MTTKEKWIAFAILMITIIGIITAIKLLPVYVSTMTTLALIFGAGSGWYLHTLYKKYFPEPL